ncbi:nitroreductase/quinone reductase family protein [Streptomyces sp. NPDC101393]|uniref:nitroreductase/quinone reductase family protein n=1 Tax=Streptomyces sp. NPDC101393 TaxID=3366141 RepID=UPI0037FDB365
MPEHQPAPELAPGPTPAPTPAPAATAGGDLLLLTTKGARSGRDVTTALAPFHDDGRLLVVGSNLGAPHHPAWYHDLLAHPIVRVQLGSEEFQAVAVPAEGARRDRLFERVVRAAPGYGDHQSRTTRILPVVVLERSAADPDEGPREIRTLADKVEEVHTWLRAQLRHVQAETEAHFASRAAPRQGAAPHPGPGLGLQIRQHCLAFCQSLEFHHTSEDAHLFPGIARHHPHLGATFDRLRDEHRTVARIQGELVGLLDGIGAADPRRFRTELHRMSGELTAHLAYEEEALLPLLADVPWPPAPPPAAPQTPERG